MKENNTLIFIKGAELKGIFRLEQLCFAENIEGEVRVSAIVPNAFILKPQ